MVFVDVGVDAGAAVAVFGRFAKQIGFNICYCMSETLLNMICIIVRFLSLLVSPHVSAVSVVIASFRTLARMCHICMSRF